MQGHPKPPINPFHFHFWPICAHRRSSVLVSLSMHSVPKINPRLLRRPGFDGDGKFCHAPPKTGGASLPGGPWDRVRPLPALSVCEGVSEWGSGAATGAASPCPEKWPHPQKKPFPLSVDKIFGGCTLSGLACGRKDRMRIGHGRGHTPATGMMQCDLPR